MSSNIDEIIDWLSAHQDDAVKKIPKINVAKLMATLQELNNFIGMEETKKSVVDQLTFLLNNNGSTDGHFLHTILRGPPGTGKCLGFNTLLMKYDGSIEAVQNIKVGDILLGENGGPKKVQSICRGQQKLYKIKQNNGMNYIANQSHVLSLKCISTLQTGVQVQGETLFYNDTLDISIKDFLSLDRDSQQQFRGFSVPITDQKFPNARKFKKACPFAQQLHALKNNKNLPVTIPGEYLMTSYKSRIKMLKFLINLKILIPYHREDKCTFLLSHQYHIDFIHSVECLCKSVGCMTQTTKNLGLLIKQVNTIVKTVSANEWQKPILSDIDIKVHQNCGDYYGFELDGNGRFLLRDLTVTHNTSLGYILAKMWDALGILQSKTLEDKNLGKNSTSPPTNVPKVDLADLFDLKNTTTSTTTTNTSTTNTTEGNPFRLNNKEPNDNNNNPSQLPPGEKTVRHNSDPTFASNQFYQYAMSQKEEVRDRLDKLMTIGEDIVHNTNEMKKYFKESNSKGTTRKRTMSEAGINNDVSPQRPAKMQIVEKNNNFLHPSQLVDFSFTSSLKQQQPRPTQNSNNNQPYVTPAVYNSVNNYPPQETPMLKQQPRISAHTFTDNRTVPKFYQQNHQLHPQVSNDQTLNLTLMPYMPYVREVKPVTDEHNQYHNPHVNLLPQLYKNEELVALIQRVSQSSEELLAESRISHALLTSVLLAEREKSRPAPLPSLHLTPPPPKPVQKPVEVAKDLTLKFKIVSRIDFVAEYLGQSGPKTKKLLDSVRGGVLLVDEAYSLYHGEKDSFGAEVIHVLNQFMSEEPESIIFIFAGYKDMLENSVFAANPGMKRRFGWTFDIPKYSAHQLANIFRKQIRKRVGNIQWQLGSDVEETGEQKKTAQSNNTAKQNQGNDNAVVKTKHPALTKLDHFFERHLMDFPNFGGDTERFLFHCKLVHARYNWQKSADQDDSDSQDALHVHVIDLKIINDAFKEYQQNVGVKNQIDLQIRDSIFS